MRAMDRQNDWFESEDCHFFDARCTPLTEPGVDTTPRTNDAMPDARPSAPQGRVMVIGFHVIRV